MEASDAPLARWPRVSRGLRAVQRLRGPLVVVAGIGTVLGGLAGYVTLYRTVSRAVPEAASAPLAEAVQVHPVSILVLPLANHSGDAARDYVADGLTAALTADLARIPEAVIVPPLNAVVWRQPQPPSLPTSAAPPPALTVQQLGRQARVRFVLQGALMASGERLRVSAQLLDAAAGGTLWSETFEGKATDLFALQDQVTSRVRISVAPRMVLAAAREAETRQQRPQAADLLLRARALALQQQSLQRHQQVEALARQALALEPGNLKATEELAVSLALQATEFTADNGRALALLAQAAQGARAVLQRDPDNVAALQTLAADAQWREDWPAAQAHLERLLAVAPRSPAPYIGLSVLQRGLGHIDQARRLLLQALELPVYQPLAEAYYGLAICAVESGDADAALDWGRRALVANPQMPGHHAIVAIALALKGDADGARRTAGHLLQLKPDYRLGMADWTPWPGREAEFRQLTEQRWRPAARLAGIPE